jgi:hypothetical protein
MGRAIGSKLSSTFVDEKKEADAHLVAGDYVSWFQRRCAGKD